MNITSNIQIKQSIGRWSARGAAAFCVAFAGFQAALALGAPFGEMSWGGSSAVLPPSLRAASAGAAVYLVLMGAAMLVRSGDLGRTLPGRPFWWINAILTFQLALNTAGNLASSNPVEQFGMGAASAAGFGLCLAALLAPPRTS